MLTSPYYIVWTRRPKRFKTLDAASEFASRYYEATGNIVAITKVD